MKDAILNLFNREWTLTEKCLLAADALLFGVLIGWITSPWRADKSVGKNVIILKEEEIEKE